jgi:hypothetical protein
MGILFAVIGIAVLAAVIFIVKKGHDAKKEPSMESKPAQAAHGENAVNGTGKDAKTIVDAIKDALKGLKEILGSGELSYEEAMKYFIVHKDDSPEIAKGALLKEAVEDGFVITQVFLDKNNNPVGTGKHGKPLGSRIRVKCLDSELLHLFKDNDLIIVE